MRPALMPSVTTQIAPTGSRMVLRMMHHTASPTISRNASPPIRPRFVNISIYVLFVYIFLLHWVTPAYLPYRLRKPSGPTPVIGWSRNIAKAALQSLLRGTVDVSALSTRSTDTWGWLVETGGGAAVPEARSATLCGVTSDRFLVFS